MLPDVDEDNEEEGSLDLLLAASTIMQVQILPHTPNHKHNQKNETAAKIW